MAAPRRFPKKTVRDVDVTGKRVLVRVDFNVPLAGSGGDVGVSDDGRIRAALPTLDYLREREARLILVSHLGRPKDREPELSMAPVSSRLAELIDARVSQAPAVVGEEVETMAGALEAGEILVLENSRFEPGETANDPELARRLALLADAYVNDAFGAAHRAHATTQGVACELPAAAGFLLEREVKMLRFAARGSRSPVRGRARRRESERQDRRDRAVPRARRRDPDRRRDVLQLLCRARTADGRLTGRGGGCRARAADARERALDRLPARAAARPRAGRSASTPTPRPGSWTGVDVPDGWMGLDIGPRTARAYASEIAAAGTVFWNGPMGAFELEPFAAGTRAVARGASRPATRSRSSEGATRRRRSSSSGSPRESRTSRPAAGRRSSCSRAGRCPAIEALDDA